MQRSLHRARGWLISGLALAAIGPALPAWADSTPATETTIELEACRLAAGTARRAVRGECGTLTVPLDYDQPDGPTVTLSVARVKALKRKAQDVAITVIAGGPGQSSLDFYAGYNPAFQRMREEYDIILVDQRGTGDSHPLTCKMPEQTIGGLWTAEQTTQVTRECLDEIDIDTRFFTTSVAVRDLDTLRAAMGYRQLSLYGISYGTRVAQHYLRRYPGSTHSVILDGVVPVDEALGPDISLLAQQALQSAFARCDVEPGCAEAFPDLAARFSTMMQSLREQPVEVTLNHPVTARLETITVGHLDLAGAIRLLSYAPQTVALLPLMIHEATNGNYVPLAAQALTVTRDLLDSMAYGMHNAVVCAEDAPFFTADAAQGLDQTYLGGDMVDSLNAVCDVWPTGVMDEDFKQVFASEVPVLILSGEADPITPPAYGERAARYLGNALHLVGRGQGHGQAAIGCMPKLMGDFVRERRFDTLDKACFDKQGPSPFFISFAGPKP
ncbi:MAG: alpha/beta hydrolase [Gammaproteobacteria bacterium]